PHLVLGRRLNLGIHGGRSSFISVKGRWSEQHLAEPVLDVHTVTQSDRHRITLGVNFDVAKQEIRSAEDLRHRLGKLRFSVDSLSTWEVTGFGHAFEIDAAP